MRSLLAVVFLVALLPSLGTAQAQTSTIEVEVLFRAPLVENPVEGEPCGYDLLSIDYGGLWPPAAQVVITHAGGVVVGVIDLMDMSEPTTAADEWDRIKPGTFTDTGHCRVEQSIEVTASPFYTFTVAGHYEWTVSAETLERLDWHWQVVFLN